MIPNSPIFKDQRGHDLGPAAHESLADIRLTLTSITPFLPPHVKARMEGSLDPWTAGSYMPK